MFLTSIRQEMSDKAVQAGLFGPFSIPNVPERFKTEEMCIKAFETNPLLLEDVPDDFKIQGTCERVVEKIPGALKFVSDYFFTREWVGMWYDDDEYCMDDDGFIKWYEGYQRRNTQKAKIKEELLKLSDEKNHRSSVCLDPRLAQGYK